MISSSSQDVSLYELALSAEQVSQPLQLSPTVFKSLLGTVLNLLIDQSIGATVWLKLPRGATWWSDVERYSRVAPADSRIYWLQTVDASGEPLEEASQQDSPFSAGKEPSLETPDLEGELGIQEVAIEDGISSGLVGAIAPTDLSTCPIYAIPLWEQSQLRREYFLLVQSPTLSVLILAHRPRSIRSAKEGGGDRHNTNLPSVRTSSSILGSNAEDTSRRKQPLLGMMSFHPDTLTHVLAGISQSIRLSQAQVAIAPNSEIKPELDNLFSNWEQIANCHVGTTYNPVLLSELMVRQVQHQEELWNSNLHYRQEADAGRRLQLENEELTNELRLKNEFLKNVGQELRTPLTTMKTALSLLNSPNLKPNQRQRYMDLIEKECDRQSNLITSVLDLIQLENVVDEMPSQPIRLIDVVPGVVSTYQPLAQEKGLMLAYTIPDNLPAVSCLNAWLRQIVINLLHNSIKFTPEGGQVWVVAKPQGDYVQIDFRDTGIGISPADIPKVFERFYRIRHGGGEEDSSGVGLGLSIVQQLLLHCGGSISVKSKLGEGSTFTVMLPAYR
jgi:signal transduction histidine kinase